MIAKHLGLCQLCSDVRKLSRCLSVFQLSLQPCELCLGVGAPADQDPCPVQTANEVKPDPDGPADFIELYCYLL